MFETRPWVLAAIIVLSPRAEAAELSAPVVAKFLRVIAIGQGKVACEVNEVTLELAKAGVARDEGAKVVYATSDKDIARFARENRLVVCGQKDQLALGATIAVVAEGGSPVIYIKPSNAAASL